MCKYTVKVFVRKVCLPSQSILWNWNEALAKNSFESFRAFNGSRPLPVLQGLQVIKSLATWPFWSTKFVDQNGQVYCILYTVAASNATAAKEGHTPTNLIESPGRYPGDIQVVLLN